ncbi:MULTISPECIES: ArdC family protein [unclassified Bradyrhizobium]|uniref:ArdC family protein n=1 Tax=unclassified Bradyrhizobium TaxID=2631580 RepID=UPI00230557C8|nr:MULTISPECIES: ArdC family protein [unclassified Bradyrhizobium]
MRKERFDIHQHLTDRIVAAIEAGAGQWQMPWHRGSGGRAPVNVASGNAYRGVNVLAFWVEVQVLGYGSHLWGTYRQWAEKGTTVRKGQKASYVVFYKQVEVASDDDAENDSKTRAFAGATPVFNADQSMACRRSLLPLPSSRRTTLKASLHVQGRRSSMAVIGPAPLQSWTRSICRRVNCSPDQQHRVRPKPTTPPYSTS